MSNSTPPQNRRAGRFIPFAIFFLFIILCFVGGLSAILFEIFTTSTGAKYSWLLLCGGPVVLVVLAVFIISNLYFRFGRPLEQLFDAINSVEEGNLSVRVPNSNSDMFSELIARFNKMVGELERAEQQRRNLTADIAHELRTPLHLIQGNLEGILDGVYQPTPAHINNTLDETRLLTRLVNDLQTLSLAETGQLPLHPTRFRIDDLLQDLTSSFSSQAASLGIALETSPVDSNLELTADYDRLNQVLSNLISNALRHTPRGGTVSIETRAGASDGRLQLVVRDTGAGIAAEDLPFVFDRFWRGDKSRTERTHSGLGLAIAKQLIHAHGGRIDVQSEGIPGRGTSFTIELPQA